MIAICGVIYLPSLFWSLGLDQNIFAEIGSLLLQGKKLYADAWDVKPPNVFYVYALFEWVFGRHEFAIRLSDYFFALVTMGAMFLATRRQTANSANHLIREWSAPVSIMLLSLTLLSLGLADTAQTESYSLAFIIVAVAFVSVPAGNAFSRCFFAGILIGIATFFKTTNAIFLLPILLDLFYGDRKRWRRGMIVATLGFILWSGLQLGVLAIEGSLSEYLRISLSVVTHHSNEVSDFGAGSLPRAIWTYLDIWAILALAAIGAAIIRRDGSFLRLARMPLLLVAAGMVAVILQRKGWGYQNVVLLPGLLPLCAISATYLFELIRNRSRKIAICSAITVLLLTLSITPSARRRMHYLSDALLSARDHSAYIATLGSQRSLYYPTGTDSLAAYLRSHTTPQDEVFILGEEPGAYWRAARMPATRFVYTLLFNSGVIPDADIAAMNDSIAKKKPAMIVLERYDTTTFRGRAETSESLIEKDLRFQSMRTLLASSYKPGDTVGDKFLIYRRTN